MSRKRRYNYFVERPFKRGKFESSVMTDIILKKIKTSIEEFKADQCEEVVRYCAHDSENKSFDIVLESMKYKLNSLVMLLVHSGHKFPDIGKIERMIKKSIDNCDADLFKFLLQQRNKVEGESSDSILAYACYNDREEFANYLITQTTENLDKSDRTIVPIQACIHNQMVGTLRLLLEKGANPNGYSRKGKYIDIHPLNLAIQTGNSEICKILLKFKSCIMFCSGSWKESTITTALELKNVTFGDNILKCIVNNIIDLNVVDDFGYSLVDVLPLHMTNAQKKIFTSRDLKIPISKTKV